MDLDEVVKCYFKCIEMKIFVFEIMVEEEFNYVKMINVGQVFFYNNVSFNYFLYCIVFYFINFYIKYCIIFFVCVGIVIEEDFYKVDVLFFVEGEVYV